MSKEKKSFPRVRLQTHMRPEDCTSKIFQPNPEAKAEDYKGFGLSEDEVARICKSGQ